MSINMFDKAAADLAMRRVRVGDRIAATFNGKSVTYMVIEKPSDGYSIYCQTPTNRVSLGIACTAYYQEELKKMRIQPDQVSAQPEAEKPRGRGRPPGAKNKGSEAQQPQEPNTYLPPGSPLATATEAAMARSNQAQKRTQTVEQLDNWLNEGLDNIMDNLRSDIKLLVQAAADNSDERAAIQNEGEPERFTCADCMYVDLDSQPTCTKFNASPPLAVVFDAANKCTAFSQLP